MIEKSGFTIDLDKIKIDEDFTLPLCEVTIYPDDESGRIYEFVALTMMDNGSSRVMTIIGRGMWKHYPSLRV